MNKEEMIKLLRAKINSDEVKDKIININNLIVDIYQEGFNICYDIMEKLYQTQLTEANNKIKKMEQDLKNGDLSDGYHTFNDLYYQRCVLFATIVNQNKSISWKSRRHENGDKCFNSDDWFVVGIDTKKGSYTYHYEIKYWDLFNCVELENGKHWDGHTEKDVDRLLSIIDGSDE